MGKKRNVALLVANLSDDPIRSDSHIINSLAIWARMSPDAPIRNLFPYLAGRDPFVISVIPFHQIRSEFDAIPQSRQASCLQSPL